MSLRVISAGPLLTIQDCGRIGFRAFGVPVSGPFDRFSAAVANGLVGNPSGDAVLELTGFGGMFEAEQTISLAMAGAPMSAKVLRGDLVARELLIPCATALHAGDRLSIGAAKIGYRSYVATRGGWRSPVFMRSRSQEIPLLAGSILSAENSLSADCTTRLGSLRLDESPIRYLDGPDSRDFPAHALDGVKYVVGHASDRMGIRLDGPRLSSIGPPDRLSIPTSPGAIQIAGGLPIILGPACGTMGGYPCAGVVLSADMDRVGQARPGSEIRFRRVSSDEARFTDRAYRHEVASTWRLLHTAVSGWTPGA